MDFRELQHRCHANSFNAGWWHDPKTKQDLRSEPLIVPVKVALIHSEVSEALEAHRRDLKDDKLPHRSGIECELADTIIRIFDLAGALGLDLEGAILEKMAYNAQREDHKVETRAKLNGKRY